MRIEYLADHLEIVPALANWHYNVWKELLPERSREQAITDLRSHVGRRQIPTTLVAIENNAVVGSASLLVSDLDGWDQLSPWVASVYVVPECRGKGIGRLLVERVVDEAGALDLTRVYLFTAGQEPFYARCGWVQFTRTKLFERDVAIMQRSTSSLECCHAEAAEKTHRSERGWSSG
jgi:predicted N-acetyltransferase YhbS